MFIYSLFPNRFMEIQDFTGEYICNNCKTEFDAPHHCGRSMIVIEAEDGYLWRCWKGEHAPCCGKPSAIKIDKCCDNQQVSAKHTKK